MQQNPDPAVTWPPPAAQSSTAAAASLATSGSGDQGDGAVWRGSGGVLPHPQHGTACAVRGSVCVTRVSDVCVCIVCAHRVCVACARVRCRTQPVLVTEMHRAKPWPPDCDPSFAACVVQTADMGQQLAAGGGGGWCPGQHRGEGGEKREESGERGARSTREDRTTPNSSGPRRKKAPHLRGGVDGPAPLRGQRCWKDLQLQRLPSRRRREQGAVETQAKG